MDGGKEETGLQRAAFLLLVVCAPVKQLFSGWCESHLERRRVSDPLTAQTFADVALVTFRSGTLQFLIPEGQPRGCARARGRGDALRTHAGLPAHGSDCKLPRRWALGCPTPLTEGNPRPQLILGNSLFLTLNK